MAGRATAAATQASEDGAEEREEEDEATSGGGEGAVEAAAEAWSSLSSSLRKSWCRGRAAASDGRRSSEAAMRERKAAFSLGCSTGLGHSSQSDSSECTPNNRGTESDLSNSTLNSCVMRHNRRHKTQSQRGVIAKHELCHVPR
jgi:hypothetical protein